jgi:hypothetical protein
LIEKIKDSKDLIHLFVSSIYNRLLDIILDVHGNHVIQNCINQFTNESISYIYDVIATNAIIVATHKHGCCVLQRFLEKGNQAQQLDISEMIINNVEMLI